MASRKALGHLEQLVKSLALRKLEEILSEALARAERDAPSYADFLEHLLQEEFLDRQVRSTEARILRAKLPEQWTLETFPFDRQKSAKPAVLRQFAGLDFMLDGTNLVFIGDTGTGKTGLSLSILRKALENGHRGLFVRAQDLFDEMYASLADRSTRNLVNRMMKMDLLLIDELGYLNIRPEQANIFFKLMEERYTNRKSTIITTNLEFEEWHEFLKNKKMADALLDRVRHRCHTIHLDGPTLRDRTG